jgi:hypothetical protein
MAVSCGSRLPTPDSTSLPPDPSFSKNLSSVVRNRILATLLPAQSSPTRFHVPLNLLYSIYSASLSVFVRARSALQVSTSVNRLLNTSAKSTRSTSPDPRFFTPYRSALESPPSTQHATFLCVSFPFFPRVDPSKAILHVYLLTYDIRTSVEHSTNFLHHHIREGHLCIIEDSGPG